jgi:hypothetical protein
MGGFSSAAIALLTTTGVHLPQCPEDLLVVAARHASLETVRWLVHHGFRIDPTNIHQRPLLEIAIRKGDVDMVDLISRSGGDLLATDSVRSGYRRR